MSEPLRTLNPLREERVLSITPPDKEEKTGDLSVQRSDDRPVKELKEPPATPQGRVADTAKQIADRTILESAQAIEKRTPDSNKQPLLCPRRAQIDQLDINGETRLIRAVYDHVPPFIDNSALILSLIHDLGADISTIDSHGNNAFDLAIFTKKYDLARLLKGEVGEEFTSEKIDQLKALAGIWTLKGRVPWVSVPRASSLNLEGGSMEKAIPLLKKYVSSFLEQVARKTELTESERNKIKKAFDEMMLSTSSQMSSMYEKIQGDNPVLISHGTNVFVTQLELLGRHTINVLFYKGQVALCNRGPGMSIRGVEIFQIDPSKINENAIRELFDERKTKTIAEFYEKIRSLCFHDFVTLEQKRQKVANCVWVSPESAVHALLYMLLKERRQGDDEASLRRKAKALYKEFSTYVRKKSLEEYLQNPHLNIDVLQQIYINVVSNPSRFGPEQHLMLARLLETGVDSHIENSLRKEIVSLEEKAQQLGFELKERSKFKAHFESVRHSLVLLHETLTKLQTNASLSFDTIGERIDHIAIQILTSRLKFEPSSLKGLVPYTLNQLGYDTRGSEQIMQRCQAALEAPQS